MSQDRRNFLKHVGTGAAAAAAVTKLAESSAQAAPATDASFKVLAQARPDKQVKLALELEGKFAGWLSSFEGGQAVGEVVTEAPSDDGISRKHIGGVKYEDIAVTSPAEMTQDFWNWLSESIAHKHARRDGAIHYADFEYNIHAVLQFYDALVTEVGMPALDAGSKDAAKMTLKFAPEMTTYKAGAGRVLGELSGSKQKTWSPANFRLTIDGLEGTTSRVSKVDALTIKQTVSRNKPGEGRDYNLEPGKIEFPNLKVTLAEIHAEQFAAWHEDFVIKGENKAGQEKSGSLEFLDASRSKVLLAIDLKNLGIFSYSPEKKSTDSDEDPKSPPQVKVEMYCEEIKLKTAPPIKFEER